jgi:hypothetical protein
MVAVRDLSPLAVQTARDAMKDIPVMANQMLSLGRTISDWAIPLDLAKLNPFDKVKNLDVPDRGHVLTDFHGLSASRCPFQLDKAWSARLFLNALPHV